MKPCDIIWAAMSLLAPSTRYDYRTVGSFVTWDVQPSERQEDR